MPPVSRDQTWRRSGSPLQLDRDKAPKSTRSTRESTQTRKTPFVRFAAMSSTCRHHSPSATSLGRPYPNPLWLSTNHPCVDPWPIPHAFPNPHFRRPHNLVPPPRSRSVFGVKPIGHFRFVKQGAGASNSSRFHLVPTPIKVEIYVRVSCNSNPARWHRIQKIMGWKAVLEA